MSRESTANVELKNTTPENTSTTNSTQTEKKPDDTTQNQDSASKPAGIIEEGTSTEAPVEGVPAEAAKEVPPVKDEPAKIEPYELELSEDSPLTDEEFDAVVLEAERLGLNKADAEKLIQLQELAHKSSNEIFERSIEKRHGEMVEAYRNEPSLHTVEAKLSMRESIKAFGNTPEFKEMFKDPSMNFNVPLAKFLISVGDKIRGGSDNLPLGKGGSVVKEGKSIIAEAANNFYKDM